MALPLPAPVQLGGDIVGASSAINALRASDLENKIKSIEAQYAPYNKYADAASKLAYSQFVGPQAIATILSNPASRGMFTPEQYNQLTNAFASQVKNPGITLGNLPIPQQEVSPFRQLMNYVTGNRSPLQTPNPIAPQQLQPFSQNSNALQHAITNQTPDQLITIGPNGEPIVTPYNENISNNMPMKNQGLPPQQLGYGTPAAQQAKQLIPGGAMGGVSPYTAQQVQEESAKASATGQANAANEQWNKGQIESSSSADAANTMINNAKGFHSAYQKAFYKGARLGALPSSGLFSPPTLPGKNLSEEQNADSYATDMLTNIGRARNSGHVTDSFYNLISRIKMDRTLDPQAEQARYKSIIATSDRMKETNHFYNYIRKQNPDVTKPEADALFSLYNTQLPPYDFSTYQPIKENKDKWRLYASKNALQQYRNNGSFLPQNIKSAKRRNINELSDEELRKIVYGQ